jgi:glucose-6-phosphate isomerase
MAAPDVTLTVADQAALDAALAELVADRFASRLHAHDATLWGPDAESEATKRLSWTTLAESSRPLVAEVEALRAELHERGLDHVVLCGMGGSSLAPEVICAAAGVELTVLDSSQPDMVRTAIADRLERTVVVVSSKSGGTVETDSQRRAYEHAFTEAGLSPADHLVVVTDPGSPLDEQATEAGYRVFHADPEVGGRYSALTAFGLVPSGLAGADIGGLLDEAADATAALFADDAANPALRLGAALGVANRSSVDKLVLLDHDAGTAEAWGVGDWIEQLVAESTGKIGHGILPVVVESGHAVNVEPSTPDSFLAVSGSSDAPTSTSGWAAGVTGGLGAQMLLWEVAVSVAGALIGINPFDQPDVESAKQAARDKLSGGGDDEPGADLVEGPISAFGTDASSLADAVEQLLAQVDDEHGYLAVQAYLDRWDLSAYAGLREQLARRTGRPVTFGWGPRFLHSTGQYHKGGPATGVFLQLTSDPHEDLAVPGRDFTFGEFIASQAAGDAQVLRDHGRPVLRLHLSDPQAAAAPLRDLLG